MFSSCQSTEQEGRQAAGWLLLILFGSALIQITGSFHAGYLSDDHDLLQTAGVACLWQPAGFHHHFAPVITALFKLSDRFGLSAAWWRTLALLAHTLNTLLVYVVARAGLGLFRGPALSVTALFAAAAAGYEALAWSCSIAYVLGLPWMLLAVLVAVRGPPSRAALLGAALAALQAGALFIWDFGAMLCPLAAVAMLAGRFPQPGLRLRPAALMLLPCLASWVLMITVKRVLGFRLDQPVALATVGNGLSMVAAAPLAHLLPNLHLPFFRSVWGGLAVLALWAALGWAAVRQRSVRTALALYLVLLMPMLLCGSLQSRYAYLAAPFLAAAIVGAATQRPGRLGSALCLLLVLAHSLFAIERSQLWRGASRAADGLRDAVSALPIQSGAAVVLVNMPDSYGPPTMIWRPFLWRNGFSVFRFSVTRVNTPGCPFTWQAAPIPILPRDRIPMAYPGIPTYEITLQEPGDWRKFQIVPSADDGGR